MSSTRKFLRLKRAANKALRPSRKKTEAVKVARTNLAREELEIADDTGSTERNRAIAALNKNNTVIFHALSSKNQHNDAVSRAALDALAKWKSLTDKVASQQNVYLNKLNEAKINLEMLQPPSSRFFSDKERLAMRENELKQAVLVGHQIKSQKLKKIFQQFNLGAFGDFLTALADTFQETRTAHRQKKLYMTVYPILDIIEYLLEQTNNPPLTEDERIVHINRIASLRFYVNVLLIIVTILLSLAVYAAVKLMEAENQLADAENTHQKINSKRKLLGTTLNADLLDLSATKKKITQIKDANITLNSSEQTQEEYLLVEKNNEKLIELLDKQKKLIKKLKSTKHSLELLKMEEEKCLALQKQCKIDKQNASSILSVVSLKIKETLETCYAVHKLTKQEVSSDTAEEIQEQEQEQEQEPPVQKPKM